MPTTVAAVVRFSWLPLAAMLGVTAWSTITTLHSLEGAGAAVFLLPLSFIGGAAMSWIARDLGVCVEQAMLAMPLLHMGIAAGLALQVA